MSPLMLALTAAMVIAGLQYMYAKHKQASGPNRDAPVPIEGTFYTFLCVFAIVFIVMYTMVDDKAAAMQEMEVGEPDF